MPAREVQPAVRLAAAAGIAALETALSPMEPKRKDAAGRGAEKRTTLEELNGAVMQL